jgi:hypothetical protein
MPSIYGNAYQIVQAPGYVAIVYEMIHETRVIPLDGRSHVSRRTELDMGDARGHWEGDTLVVETNNIRAATIDRDGVPYSDKMTVLERIRRVSPTRMEIETTLTDPEALVEPYTIRRAYTPMPPGSRFEEYLCENNRDL